MIIEKIDIRSFGLLKDMTLEFAPTVNVIEGQNEAGKSTIAAFIKYMLFGFDTVENEDTLSERKKRINWETGMAEGSMVVRVKDKRYLISRSTTPTVKQDGRPAYKEESSIIDMESGATAFGKVPAGEVFFGVTRDLFENTAFLGQIGDSAINEGSVKESIENILFSGSEKINNQRAMTKISEKMEGLVHRGGGGGVIHELMHKQEVLEEAMARSNEDNKQILAKETELFKIRQERLEAESKLERLFDLSSSYNSVMLIDTFDKLHELEEECVQKTEAYNAFLNENTRAGYVPTDSYITEIGMARRGVNEAYHALADADDAFTREKNAIGITREIEGAIEHADEEGGEENILARALGYVKGLTKSISLATVGALGTIAVLVYQIIANGVLAHVAFRVIGGLLGAGALALAVYSAFGMFKHMKNLDTLSSKFGVTSYNDLKGKIAVISAARAKRDGMIRSTEDARIALEAAKLNYENSKQELTRVIIRWGEEPPTSSLNEFLDRLEAKVAAFLEKKRVLLEEKNTIELTVKELRQSLSDKNEIDIRGQVPPLKRKALTHINHDEIITSIAAYKNKILELDRMIYTVESEITALKANSGDPAEYYSKVKTLETRIEELRQKHKAYFIAYKAIEGASDNLRAGISPRLGEFSTELMGVMTDKKYGDFDVTDGLKVSYKTEDGESRTVDFLSGGTRDLAYIAVRMALIDMLYPEKPPICLDESFAHQDNIRAKSMMKSLSHLADDGYQSFIFTCRARESALASELVKKPGIFQLSVVE
ncbi:MAG: AAA family ATPase [Clostridia bacterium]|nr:AAA family ATPase [Clostridia bacterium]